MNQAVRRVSSFLFGGRSLGQSMHSPPWGMGMAAAAAGMGPMGMMAVRGIRVRVRNGNLEQALVVMQRKMTSSGMERLLKRASQQRCHLKDSEKRVLARKRLERKIRSQELSKKLRSILVKKIRGL